MSRLAFGLDGRGALLLGAVHALTAHRLVEIDLVGVELRAVDAREARPSADRHAAGAAHARTVDHQRVERHGGLQTVFLRGEGHELHHDHRSDGHAFVVVPALFFDEFLDDLRHQSFEALRTVVGGDVEVLGDGPHGVGIDQHVARLRADDDVGADPVFPEPFDLRIDRGRAHSARYEEVVPFAKFLDGDFDELRGVAQRPCEVGEGVALFECAYLARRGADGLRDDRHAALRGVEIGNCERNAFAVFVDAHDDELSGLCRTRYARCEDLHQPDAFREASFFKNGVHYVVLSVCVSLFDDRRDPQAPHWTHGVVGHHHEVLRQHAEILRRGVEEHFGPERIPRGYRPARRERRGDVSFTLHGPDDQRCVARVRKRERQLPPRARVLHRAKFKDIFREFGSRALLCRIGRPRVDADAVRYDRRAVAAAVDGDLQRIAQGAVAGFAGRDEVGEVDLAPLARCDPLRSVYLKQAALVLRAQREPDRAVRGVGIADRPLHLPALIYIGEGAERRGQPQAPAGVDRVKFFEALFARRDIALYGDRGDFLPLVGVDPQLLGEGAGAVHGIIRDGDLRLAARGDGLAREFGHRAAAGGHHVEDHQRLVAAVDAREGVADAAVALADGAEIPGVGFENQTGLCGGGKSGERRDNEEYDSFC